MTSVTSRLRRIPWLPVAPALLGLAACSHRAPRDLPAPVRFSMEVRRVLTSSERSPEFHRARTRLEQMGPEVDAVLVTLVRDPEARMVARQNAVLLLADRNSPAALPVLRRVLLAEPDEELRAAAVLGLQRLPASDAVRSLIRSAVGDAARTVRLNALQALDTRDVATIRALLEREEDPEVRKVAVQLVALAESRGAPLSTDRRGALRTMGADTDAEIVFRPTQVDSVGGFAIGDLRVELPHAPDISLAPMVEAVAGVVPAFFSPDRTHVVYEAEREIRVVSLPTRSIRSLGPGVAPRPVPFADQFVFLRPLPVGPAAEGAPATELRYAVYRVEFAGSEPEWLGELRAEARPDRHANYSPVRWMVVAETPEGFVLRGEGIDTFLLPAPTLRPGSQDARRPRTAPPPPRGGFR